MRTDSLVDRLTRELRPVRPRSFVRDGALLVGFGLVQLAAILGLGFMRPDIAAALEMPSFWWKLTSTGLIAGLSAAVTLLSADPARSPRRGLRWITVCIAAVFASGWLVDASSASAAGLMHRLDWEHGLHCVLAMVALSLPAIVALGILLRHGAPTDGPSTALAGGLASAGWGAFVFVFACPYDDPLFIMVWYTVGCAIAALCGRFALAHLARW